MQGVRYGIETFVSTILESLDYTFGSVVRKYFFPANIYIDSSLPKVKGMRGGDG